MAKEIEKYDNLMTHLIIFLYNLITNPFLFSFHSLKLFLIIIIWGNVFLRPLYASHVINQQEKHAHRLTTFVLYLCRSRLAHLSLQGFLFFKGENSAILPSVATLLLLFFAWDTIEHAIATTNDLLGFFRAKNIKKRKNRQF